EHLTVGAVHHIKISIAFRSQKHLARLPIHRQVDEDLLVDAIVVVQVVWSELVEPARFPGVYVARKDSARPLVVARTLIRIPWAWISSAVKDEILFRVVRDPTPH